MTEDQATKIAAMVSELGKLRADFKHNPTQAAVQRMRDICRADHAEDACFLALGVMVEASDNPVMALVDITLSCASLLSVFHREADTRRVSRSEVLKALAETAAKLDDGSGDKLRDLLAKLRDIIDCASAAKATTGSDDSSGGKQGAN